MKALFLLMSLQLISVSCLATTRSVPYQVMVYNTDNGLPQNSVKSIAFDKEGFCWLATEMGLVRFDGRNFKVFGAGQTKGQSWSRVHSIMYDRAGELHVSFVDESKADIRRLGHEATLQPIASGKVKGLHSRAGFIVDERLIDELGSSLHIANIWDRFSMDFADNRIVGLDFREAYVFLDNQIYYLNNGLVRHCELQTISARMLLLDSICVSIEKGNRVNAWKNGGRLKMEKTVAGDLSKEKAFLEGNFKTLWCPAGSYIYCNARLYRLTISGNTIYSIRVFEDLMIKDVNSISVDNANQIYYLGSGINGLYVVRPSRFFVPSLPDGSSLVDQNYYTQAVIDGNSLYCRDALFFRDGSSQLLPIGSDQPSILQPVAGGKLYFGDQPDLNLYDFKKRKSTRVATLDGRITGMLHDSVKNNLYLTTSRSIYILQRDTIRAHYLLPVNSGSISCFIKEDESRFIIGSTKGLYWYSAGAIAWERTILDSINIRTIYKEPDGALWIGTYGNGFFLYDQGKLKEFPAGPLGSLKTVHAFVDDGRGCFWLSTNNGLFKVSKAELRAFGRAEIEDVYYHLFNKQDGLPTNEFNGGFQLPYAWFADSMLSLPTLDGLVWFKPHEIRPMFPNKAIYLDRVLLDETILPSDQVRFEVPPGRHTLSLWVTSPYFGHPQNMQLEYQIEGAMNNWRRLTGDGKVLLQNLSSGSYNVVFRKRDGNSFTSFDRLSVQVDVKPFFFQQWWFMLIVVLLLILLTYAIVQWRIKRLIRKSHELEENVKARTAELKQVIGRLQRSEKSLASSVATKDQVISMVLHDLQSPIRFLDMLGRRLARDQASLDESALDQRIGEIKNSTGSLYSFTTQFFAWAKSQHSQFSVNIKWIVIQEIFDNIALLYTDILKSKDNHLIIHPTDLRCYTDPDLLTIILRNLVDNAHKNTNGGKVELSVRLDEMDLFISLTDTGVGMDEDQIDAFLHKKVTRLEGLGGMVVTTLLEKMGGRLMIQSRPGEGSTFIIRLPFHP